MGKTALAAKIHTSAFVRVFAQITEKLQSGVKQLHRVHLGGHFPNISRHAMFPDTSASVVGAKRHLYCRKSSEFGTKASSLSLLSLLSLQIS